jgi:hypothetical protein
MRYQEVHGAPNELRGQRDLLHFARRGRQHRAGCRLLPLYRVQSAPFVTPISLALMGQEEAISKRRAISQVR